jgi:hypothetical protein
MATLTTKVVPHTGLILASADYAPAAAGGDKAATGAGVQLLVHNGDTAQHTVTVAVPEKIDANLTVSPRPVPIPAGDYALIPLLDLYKDPATGLASWTYDAVTAVGVVAIRTA